MWFITRLILTNSNWKPLFIWFIKDQTSNFEISTVISIVWFIWFIGASFRLLKPEKGEKMDKSELKKVNKSWQRKIKSSMLNFHLKPNWIIRWITNKYFSLNRLVTKNQMLAYVFCCHFNLKKILNDSICFLVIGQSNEKNIIHGMFLE